MTSILEQARAAGYREGVSLMAQVSADEVDEAFRRGWAKGQKSVRLLALRWFWFGVLCGAGVSTIVWDF